MENKKTSGITGSLYITRPLTHFGKTAMGKGLGERALYADLMPDNTLNLLSA